MKSKFLFSLFSLAVLLFGLTAGFLIGTSVSAGSNTTQLYAGAIELTQVNRLIEQQSYEKAQEVICNSLKARLNILRFAKPVQGFERDSEADQIEAFGASLGSNCV